MKVGFKHKLASSFVLWFDHTLCHEGQAYTNYGSKFYAMDDAKLAGYSVYSSAFGQLVYDASVSGANVMSGVYVNNVFTQRGTNGLRMDFNKGRAILNKNLLPLNVSGNFAFKEFDVVYSTMPEDELILSSQFSIKPNFYSPPTGLASNQIGVPAIFITKVNSNNDGYQLGTGADKTTSYFRALIVGTQNFQLDGIDDIFTNKKETYFTLLDDTPFNEFGDLKSGVYNYVQTCQNFCDPSRLAFIRDCSFTKFSAKANAAINSLLNLAVLEFTIEMVKI